MGERAADRAAVPHLRVADQRCGVGEQGCLNSHELTGREIGVPGRGADDEVATLHDDPRQLPDPPEVDEHAWRGEPQLHHRKQRVPARQQLGVLAEGGEQVDRVPRGLGGVVVKRGGDHAWFPGAVAVAPAATCSLAAASTARTMLWYPVHRHRLPSRLSRTCCSVGSGFCAIRLTAASTMPGVQNPHCSPCSARKARWTGCSSPGGARPSVVTTSCPAACTVSTVHDLTDSPSSSTVHAPLEVVSQPTFA